MSEFPLLAALDAAETNAAGKRQKKPGPAASRSSKKNYAQRLSNQLAITVADALRPSFPSVTPRADGTGQESQVGVAKGTKRLDVKVTDLTLGLLLSVSIKTYSFQDYSPSKKTLGRWTKNIVRNDHELRGEAMVLHQRQPYSVLVAIMFEPVATTADGKPELTSDTGKSSFAHHVLTLAKRTGRGRRVVHGGGSGLWVDFGAEDTRYDLFERVFIGLYETDGPRRGAVRFFDVQNVPPRNGPPSEQDTLTFDELVAAIKDEVNRRNNTAPVWTDPEDADPVSDNPAADDGDAAEN